MEARVVVIVVTFNSARHIKPCLASIRDDRRIHSVIVVDNKSTDDTERIVRDHFPEFRFVQTGANIGFGRAVNRGLAAALDAEYVCILNPDAVLASGAIDALISFLDEHEHVAVVGPQVRNLDGSVYPSARSFPKPLTALGHAFLGVVWKDNPISNRYRNTDLNCPDWVSGTAMMARRVALDQVSGFDERYFMYVEDLDLCWRLRRQGWQIGYCADAVVTHEIGGSSGNDRRSDRRLIVEHHRSAWRFARRSTSGFATVMLPLYAGALGVRLAFTLAFTLRKSRNGKLAPSRG
jgi:N-acetylglucosaminyl-diphospho-decaprenol L-rhamnosyltransferase